MSPYSRDTKLRARAAREASNWVARISSLAGLGVVAMGKTALGAYLIFTGSFFREVENASERIANDPTRDDYDSSTRVSSRARRTRSLRKRDGGAPAAEPLDLNGATFHQLRELGLSRTQTARLIALRKVRRGFDPQEEIAELPGLHPEQAKALRSGTRF